MTLTRREFIKNTGIISAGVLGCLSGVRGFAAKKDQKKNLLFIMTDQQRFDALGFAGNTVLQTPNLDTLAAQGAYFKNAYTPCAVCAPARSSILTGHTVENTGMRQNAFAYDYYEDGLMTMPTFDEILTDEGYRCEYYGKWHSQTTHTGIYQNPLLYANNGRSVFLGGGQTHIFRDYLAVNEPNRPLEEGEFYGSLSKRPYKSNPLDKYHGMTAAEMSAQGLEHSQPEQHGELQVDPLNSMTAFQANQTIEAIQRLQNESFCITCSFHFPHAPMLPIAPFNSMYPPENMVPPASISDNMHDSPYRSANGRLNNTEYADPEKIKYMIANYYGLVSEIDHWVGQILNKLDELNLTENTMVIFVSDHGEMLGAHGMREKNVFYEESSHIPLLIRFPNEISPNTNVDGYISTIDLFPTIMDYLGIEPRECDGKSLRGLIEGTDEEHGQYVVTEWDYRGDSEPNLMIVKDGWKMFIPQSASSNVMNALYDLNTDPHEMNNLFANIYNLGQYYYKVEELRSCLLEWLEKNNSSHYNGVRDRVLITDQPIEEIMEKFEVRSHTFENTTLPYRLFIPENYDPAQSYPLMLSLHGEGERGTDNVNQIKMHSLATVWVKEANQSQQPCFVLAPQCSENQQWVDTELQAGTYDIDSVPVSNELLTVINLLDNILEEFNIDRNRQYVAGLSMGGYSVWDIITRYPDRFAAAIPMSGAGDPSKTDLFGNTPIWCFHNSQDDIVPVEGSIEMVEAMENAGIGVVRTTTVPPIFLDNYIKNGAQYLYTESEDGNHGPWDAWFCDPNLHLWVFMQSKVASVIKINNITTPKTYKLYGAFPNPFNPTTTIKYQTPKDGKVKLVVNDIRGREVATLVDMHQSAGKYQVKFNASNLSSGIYLYRIRIGGFTDAKRIMLLK